MPCLSHQRSPLLLSQLLSGSPGFSGRETKTFSPANVLNTIPFSQCTICSRFGQRPLSPSLSLSLYLSLSSVSLSLYLFLSLYPSLYLSLSLSLLFQLWEQHAVKQLLVHCTRQKYKKQYMVMLWSLLYKILICNLLLCHRQGDSQPRSASEVILSILTFKLIRWFAKHRELFCYP